MGDLLQEYTYECILTIFVATSPAVKAYTIPRLSPSQGIAERLFSNLRIKRNPSLVEIVDWIPLG